MFVTTLQHIATLLSEMPKCKTVRNYAEDTIKILYFLSLTQ